MNPWARRCFGRRSGPPERPNSGTSPWHPEAPEPEWICPPASVRTAGRVSGQDHFGQTGSNTAYDNSKADFKIVKTVLKLALFLSKSVPDVGPTAADLFFGGDPKKSCICNIDGMYLLSVFGSGLRESRHEGDGLWILCARPLIDGSPINYLS